MDVHYCDRCGESSPIGVLGKFKIGDFSVSTTSLGIVDNSITMRCLCPHCISAAMGVVPARPPIPEVKKKRSLLQRIFNLD